MVVSLTRAQVISIHAPTRGATTTGVDDLSASIFQSTLPREERLFSSSALNSVGEFQSTLPREERLVMHEIMAHA